MLIPELGALADVALLLLRLMIAAIFGTSGWSHVTRPKERAASIEMSPAFTLALGVVELVGATSLVLGLYPQIGAVLLIGVMLGAIHKKMFAWKTGFWGKEGQGWYYDLLYLVCNLVILTTGGGAITLT
ncbi:MAG TPA: DoxX family protein [Longimicrobiales bacterium]|nr:DoxX family protein [Longimicrobiales bacterium]